jgi:hypothetical protein
MSELMSDVERLAVATALEKALHSIVNPHGADGHGAENSRTRVDDKLRRMYEEDGVTQLHAKLNGQKVGTISARISKPTSEQVPVIDSIHDFRQWCHANADDLIDGLLAQNPTGLVDTVLNATGELPDGVVMRDNSRPSRFTGTTVRIDPQKVVDALGPELTGTVTKLLTDGDDA